MNNYAEKTGRLEKMEHQELLEEESQRTAEGLAPANRPTEPGLNRTEPYSPTAAATERLLNPWSEEPSEGKQTTINYHKGGKGGVASGSYLQAVELLLLHQRLLHQHALDALLHSILFSLQGEPRERLATRTTGSAAGSDPLQQIDLLQSLLLVGGEWRQAQLRGGGGGLSVLHDERRPSL